MENTPKAVSPFYILHFRFYILHFLLSEQIVSVAHIIQPTNIRASKSSAVIVVANIGTAYAEQAFGIRRSV
jgi:hypothetical protein